jgi:hypothetical protein
LEEFRSELRKLFFSANSAFGGVAEQDVTNKSDKVRVSGIMFENSNSRDQRLQIEFLRDSETFKAARALLVAYGLFDEKNEDIGDLSILIGGTEIQEPHGDFPRLFCVFKTEELEENVEEHGYELNRKTYNASVSSKHGPSSVIMDLSEDNDGFNMALPNCYLKR